MILRDLLSRFSPLPLLSRFRIAAGLIVLLILIWTLGPAIGLSTQWCLLLSLFLLVGYGAMKLWRYQNNKKHSKQAKQELKQQQDSGVDLLPLRKNIASAINTLRSSQLGQKMRGSATVYALPWFLMLGSSGSGKSSLLRNSGLHFPMNSDEEIQLKGFSGTKDVDWWFADEAVIVDTAGRYTTNKQDHVEWLGFLQLLKRHRWRLPVNGVVIALSLEELLMADEQKMEQQATTLRDRICELNQHLGYVLPISLVITKSDLLSGFSELFSAVAKEQGEQAWGVSLQKLANDQNINESLKEQFSFLQQRLVNFALQHLELAGKNANKAKAYKFVSQFQSVIKRMEDFIFMITHENPYQAEFNLRGVYFTSAAQQGLQLEKILQDGKTQFDHLETVEQVERDKKTADSFFITNMFRGRIFNDKNSAVMNRRTQLLFNGAKYGVMSMIGVALALMIIFWGFAYAFNHNQLTESVNKVGHLHAVLTDQQADQWDLLSAQLDVYQQYHQFADYDNEIPSHKRMGLYRGNDQQANLQQILGVSMQNNFLYPVATNYEQQLVHYEKIWPHLSKVHQQKMYLNYYQVLRNYLQLGVYDPNENSADVEAITNVWVNLLAKQKNNDYGSMLNTAQLAHLVEFYLQNQYSGVSPDSLAVEWMPKRNLIATARAQLRRPIDVGLLNDKLQQILQSKMAPVAINTLLPSDAAQLFVDSFQLPSMYTKQAWQDVVAGQIEQLSNQASAGDWVLNQPITINQDGQLKPQIDNTKPDPVVAAKLKGQMLNGYFKAYLQAWFSWMQHLRLKNFTSLSTASDAMIKLSKSDGPMVELLQSVASNLQIKDPNSHWRLFAKNNEAPYVYQALTGAGDFINSSLLDKNTDAVKQYLQAIKSIQTDLENISISSNQQQGADKYAKAILSGSASGNNLYSARIAISHLLENVSHSDTQAALNAMLITPLRASWRAVLLSAEQQIQQQWQNQVIPAYQNEIAGKAPFAAEGPDISIEPVQSFFGPKVGTYWKFINAKLGAYLTQQGMQWQTNKWLGVGMPLSPAFMQSLNQAENISSTLFSNGTSTPKFDYSLYPIPEPHISEFKVTVNNQKFVYANGPQQWRYYHWSMSQTPLQTTVTAIKNDGEARARLFAGGPWGLFKLLAKAQDIHKVGSYYLVHWLLQSSDGSTIRTAVRFRTDGPADSVAGFVAHPFKPPYALQENKGDNS